MKIILVSIAWKACSHSCMAILKTTFLNYFNNVHILRERLFKLIDITAQILWFYELYCIQYLCRSGEL